MTVGENMFESLRRIDENGQEYWSARGLGKIFEYSEYRKFLNVIERAKLACTNSGKDANDQFVLVDYLIEVAKGALYPGKDYRLTRYACYLVAQNASSEKEPVALAQTYFAVQTRKQEVKELFIEDSKRVKSREELTGLNKTLAVAADESGVTYYGQFHDEGYKGLYGGETQKDIKKRKELGKKEKILDHIGSEELGANIFRVTQTEAKLKREGKVGQARANTVHNEIGKKVRKTIEEIGGAMPEALPNSENIKVTKKRLKVLKIKENKLT